MNAVLDQSLVGRKYILVSSEVHQHQVSALNHGEDAAGKLNPFMAGLQKKPVKIHFFPSSLSTLPSRAVL